MFALLIAGCSGADEPPPALKAIDDGNVYGTIPHSESGVAYIWITRSLSTTGGSVQITNVSAAAPTGGMKVSSWGVRHEYPGKIYPIDGPISGRVSQMRGFGHHQVTVKCGDRNDSDDFAVSVSRTAAVGTMTGVWIDYGSGKRVFAQDDLVTCPDDACRQG
jgi:hypothetical protein